ncbi:MAG: phospholipase D-like domain-containing protein [Nanoarchaeota archaeon]|nr:phospholipase D-like domain-containing protein [Nanoarchaeota archaeon]
MKKNTGLLKQEKMPKNKVNYKTDHKINYKKYALYAILLLLISTLIFHQIKPLPEGVNIKSNIYSIDENQLTYLQDITYFQGDERITEHKIFDEVISMIQEAQDFIIIDMFLFNEDFTTQELKNSILVKRNITSELTQALITKKQENSNITIIFITDGINNFYGSFTPKHYPELKENNITIIETDVHKLRDSNYIYSTFYRVFLQWFGVGENGIIPHPLGNDQHNVTLRSGLKLLNFKANHRKLIITHNIEGYSALITSANPHTPSNLHSNVALRVDNSAVISDMVKSELGVASFSTKDENILTQLEQILNTTQRYFNRYEDIDNRINDIINTSFEHNSTIQFLSEKQIKNSILKDIQQTQKGDIIELSMFYFSSRSIINELKLASKRGVIINIILDPNVDAFGHEKNGIPNRVVAHELLKNTNISIRWYNTNSEQFHSKQLTIYKIESNTTIIHLGSTNYTRRNLDNFNLEANIKIQIDSNSQLSNSISESFSRIWNNYNDIEYTLDVEEYLDDSKLKYIWYRIQEFTGLGTF